MVYSNGITTLSKKHSSKDFPRAVLNDGARGLTGETDFPGSVKPEPGKSFFKSIQIVMKHAKKRACS